MLQQGRYSIDTPPSHPVSGSLPGGAPGGAEGPVGGTTGARRRHLRWRAGSMRVRGGEGSQRPGEAQSPHAAWAHGARLRTLPRRPARQYVYVRGRAHKNRGHRCERDELRRGLRAGPDGPVSPEASEGHRAASEEPPVQKGRRSVHQEARAGDAQTQVTGYSLEINGEWNVAHSAP